MQPAAVTAPTVTAGELATAIDQADNAYVSSRQNAANAAATVYYIWYHTSSAAADAQNKEWHDQQVAKRAAEIDQHNAVIDADKKQVADDAKKAIALLRAKKKTANDPTTIADCEQQITALQATKDSQIQALTADRWVKLETRSDANKWSGITKYVLRLNKPTQASQVSRFATVVTWIAANCAATTAPNVAAIAATILANGGFDNVYEMQHAQDTKENLAAAKGKTSNSANDNNATKTAVAAHFNDVVATADSLGIFALEHKHEQNGLVALIGRVGTDGISIISELLLSTDEVLRLCVEHNDQKLLPGDAGSEFVAIALAAGELVEESTRAMKDGDAIKISREISILADEDGAKLVLSALNADSSVVVHAVPKVEAARALLAKQGFWKLHNTQVLPSCLGDGIERKMVALSLSEAERTVGDNMLTSAFAWVSTNKAKAALNMADAVMDHPWLQMSPYQANPIDIEGFTGAGNLIITHSELMKLVQGNIGNWKAEKQGSSADAKKAAQAKVTFSKTTIHVDSTKGVDEADCSGSIKGKVTLTFRPRILAKALRKLADFAAENYEFSPDELGALRCSFETAYGRYSIYLPTCDKDGALEKRRFAAIRVTEDADA
jgi:uncharacterized protein with PIN domain